jgi:hypothetical protein
LHMQCFIRRYTPTIKVRTCMYACMYAQMW